jgi:NAD(P)-dependent dehydrogenase (short-subunit alcohol dehydrogenase family)
MSKTACAPCHFARTIYRRHRLQGAANSGADVRTVLEAATLLTQNPAHPNVRNADEPSSTLAASVTAFGVLLFVNAGFSIPTPLESVTEAIYDEMFNLNAKGPFFAVQKLAPMISRGGSVVLTTSIANVKGMPGQATYGAAKAALRSFARTPGWRRNN